MLDFGFYNIDCMEGMKQFPDKYFDLAVVDPPYGINIGSNNSINNLSKKVRNQMVIGGAKPFGSKKNVAFIGGCNITAPKVYKAFDDSKIPEASYFEELKRVSKKQIIWGGELLP